MQYSNEVITQAVLLTGVVVVGLGVLAMTIKADVISTKFFSYLMMTQFFTLLFGWIFFSAESAIYSVLGSLAACAYLVIDL